MTNIIAQITMSLILVTNWTGHNFNSKELGYVATNHVATILYQNQTNEYVLKTVASEIAVWRELMQQGVPIGSVTNYWHTMPGLMFTNRSVILTEGVNAN